MWVLLVWWFDVLVVDWFVGCVGFILFIWYCLLIWVLVLRLLVGGMSGVVVYCFVVLGWFGG